MWNKIPVVGWLISFVGAFGLAFPFWLCWTVGGIGRTYFYWLPPVYQLIPFWDCVGLFIVVSILRVLRGLVPTLASVSQTVTQPAEKK